MNENRKQKEAQQELVTNRIMVMFVFTVVLLMAMSYVYRMMTFGTTFVKGLLLDKILIAVSGVATLGLIGFSVYARKKGTFPAGKTFNSDFFATGTAMLFASSVILYLDYAHGMRILYVFLPVVAVLYLIFHICERSFFTFCMMQAVSIAAAYYCYTGARRRFVLFAVAALICLFPAVLALVREKKDMLVRAVLGGNYSKKYTVLASAVTLCVLIAALVLGGKAALVLMILLGVFVLASAVYYTVRSM